MRSRALTPQAANSLRNGRSKHMKNRMNGRAIKLGSARELTQSMGGTKEPEIEAPIFQRLV